MLLNFTAWAGLAAAGAALAAGWRQFLALARYFGCLIVGRVALKDEAAEAVLAYAFSQARVLHIGVRVFGGHEAYVHPKRWRETVGYESLSSDPILIRYERSFALVSLCHRDDKIELGHRTDYASAVVTVFYLRWSFKPEQFVIDAIQHYNAQKRQQRANHQDRLVKKCRSRFRLIRVSGGEKCGGINPRPGNRDWTSQDWDCDVEKLLMLGVYQLLEWTRQDLQLQPEEGQSAFTGYPFPPQVAQAIKEVQLWLENEKWFRSKSIPWRRGWLLHGVAGTGKTTLTRGLGMAFGLPVYVYDLATMSNNELVEHWDEMLADTPCIALIEDIDNVFNGRQYVGPQTRGAAHLTFDCLLNTIGGLKASDGVFLIVTTNRLERLDAALGIPNANGKSTRPGRIDKVIHLDLMRERERLALARYILADWPELIEPTIRAGAGETAAQFQDRCAQLALGRFWKEYRTDSRANSNLTGCGMSDSKHYDTSKRRN